VTRPVRVVIVDDSITVRQILKAVISRASGIEVVGEAPEPAVARQMIKDLNPDVITLDVEMPNMNGLEFLEKIMRLRPMPVVMVSTLTQRGADITLSALELGAVDYFPKPTDNAASLLETGGEELVAKLKAAAQARVRPLRRAPEIKPVETAFDPGNSIVAIGSSTGGVEALLQVLSHFPANCPPTVITQHMPPHFTTSFAARLSRLNKPEVREARDGDVLRPGHVYLAPGGDAHLEIAGHGTLRCRLNPMPTVSGHRPSVDVLFRSVAAVAGRRAVGVILTGMGADGAKGLLEMRKAGAATIGQDEATSIIYGMPRAAYECGAVEAQFPLEKIGAEIIRLCAGRTEKENARARSS
jgi:two-component system chemotaxis response regulator CheB